jgi:hypothetical protein
MTWKLDRELNSTLKKVSFCIVATNQVFVVVAKYTGIASKVSESVK